MRGGTGGGAEAFDALVMAGRLADAAQGLRSSLPSDCADFAAELKVWLLDHADLERQPPAERREPWTREQRRLRQRLLALHEALQARLKVRAQAAALVGARDAGGGADAVAASPPEAPSPRSPARASDPARVRAPSEVASPVRTPSLGAQPAGQPRAGQTGAAGVFVSFSHRDLPVALKLQRQLQRLGVAVRIDATMQPGANIRQFIESCLRETACTLCILSEHSLMSDWVALESTLALSAGTWGVPRRLVGGYLDTSFQDPDFALRVIDSIDQRVAELQQHVRGAMARGIDFGSLATEVKRLTAMRAGLDSALEHFRSTLCLDLRPRRFAASLRELAASLTAPDVR